MLRDERAKFDGEGDQEEEPVEQDDAIGVSEARVLEPLDREDDEEREDRSRRCPDTKITQPNILVANYLECELCRDITDDEGQQGLRAGSTKTL